MKLGPELSHSSPKTASHSHKSYENNTLSLMGGVLLRRARRLFAKKSLIRVWWKSVRDHFFCPKFKWVRYAAFWFVDGATFGSRDARQKDDWSGSGPKNSYQNHATFSVKIHIHRRLFRTDSRIHQIKEIFLYIFTITLVQLSIY